MWIRAELKSLAKESLKGNYWKAFLISLVLAFVSNGGGAGNSGNAGDSAGEYIGSHPDGTIIIVVIALIILAIAFRFLLGYSLEIGSRKYFVKLSEFKNTDGCYSFAFDSPHYRGIIGSMFIRDIYLLLWTLLFVIPGIIKSYSYLMVPYILTDNPNMGADKAITLSRKMMDGNKADAFVLHLSFIGWYLLGALAFIIGMFFVNPYFYATEAQLYLALRKNAIDSGLCTYEDFNLQRETNDFNDYNNYDNYNNYKSDEDYLNRDDK